MRLSYANVTATLALFVALGGSGYAATKIHGKDIAARTIGAKNVKKGTLTGSEIARGSITQSKLSRGVRALLPAQEGDSGFPGQDSLPPLDGRDGEPGPEGEPGPPGSGCSAEQGLLCGDADLPTGQTAAVMDGTTVKLRATAYRTSCRPADTPDCVVLLAGATPAIDATALYEGGVPQPFDLTVGPASGPVRKFTVTGGTPIELRNQTDRYQLTLSAATVVESALPPP